MGWMQGFPPPADKVLRVADGSFFARLASHPVAANAANDPTSLPACEAVAEYLMKRK